MTAAFRTAAITTKRKICQSHHGETGSQPKALAAAIVPAAPAIAQTFAASQSQSTNASQDDPALRFRMPTGPSLEEAHEQIQRFGEEVVQPIHKKYPAPDHPALPEVCRW